MVGQRAPALRMVRECAVCESECSLVVSSAHVVEHSGAVQRPEPEVPVSVRRRRFPCGWTPVPACLGPLPTGDRTGSNRRLPPVSLLADVHHSVRDAPAAGVLGRA